MSSLESCALFQGLGPDALAALQASVQERAFRSGKMIFDEGQVADGLYVVKEGEVEVSAAVDGSGRRLVSRLGPGESFGEMALIEDKPRSASVRASRDVTLFYLPSHEFNKLVDKHPSITRALTRQVSNRLREFTRQYIRETLESERMALVGRFTGAIIHDLKNPLNIIGISSELLAADDLTSEQRNDTSKRIRRQVERIADMVSEVLEFTRTDKQSFIPARINYALFLQQMIEEEKPALETRGVVLNVVGDLPEAELLLHPKRLLRVFANLFHNAAEAMNDDGILTLRFREAENGIVTEVQDTGPGVPVEVADRLFEAFVTHGKPQGTGLGLAIARRIIEDHNGWITAENRPDQGALFTLWLPLLSQV